MSSCELCGRSMKGRGRNIVVEGTSLIVCPQCAAKFGGKQGLHVSRGRGSMPTRPSWIGGPEPAHTPTRVPQAAPAPPRKKKASPRPATLDDMILVEDYAARIRTARQKARLSQEELAQKIGERISTLQAIEAGRLKPTRKAIRGLERELDISLLEPIGTAPVTFERGRSSGRTPTLGDVVRIKRKKPKKPKKDE